MAYPRLGDANAFWETLASDYWEQRPGLFRDVLRKPPVTEAQLLAALKAGIEDDSLGGRGDVKILHDAEILRPDLIPKVGAAVAAARKRAGLRAYLQALADFFEDRQFGLHVTRFQNLTPEVWKICQGLAAPLVKAFGAPRGALHAAAFVGTYMQTPFGPHRDAASNLMFPILGKKSMFLWPPDYFEKRGVAVQGDQVVDPDPTPYLADAIELTAEPGDIMYWPSSYWHTPLQVIDGYHATVSLGYWFSCASCPHHSTLWA